MALSTNVLIPFTLSLAILLTSGPNASSTATGQPAVPPTIQSISYTTPTQNASGWAYRPAISADGRWIAFSSNAADLVPGDTNSTWDVFVRDRLTGQIERVSLGLRGEQADGLSGYGSTPSISADGRLVAFASIADNLAPGDDNQAADIFVHDRLTGETELVSRTPQGAPGSGWSDWPAISGDGRYVSFTSMANNLVPGDANGARDIFRYDRLSGQMSLVSLAADGSQAKVHSGWASAISQDGRVIAFASPAASLVPDDRNHSWDVFIRDFASAQTQRISVSNYLQEGDRDSGYWSSLGISADGSQVVFQSGADNLVPADHNYSQDIFIRDWKAGWTKRVSLNSDGNEAGGDCLWPAISPDGRFVSFTCQAGNLVKEDANDNWDVFVRDTQNHHTTRVSATIAGDSSEEASGYWNSAPLSNGGEWIAFPSRDGQLAGQKSGNRGAGGWNVYLANFQILRGTEIVKEASLDLDMPYCKEPAPTFRGCKNAKGCGGAYHGFDCGVCTDLVMDAYKAGSGMDLQAALWNDRQAHPERRYDWGDMRSAQDMRLYFDYTKNMLAWKEPFLPGDMAFFDWDGDGTADHVALISRVDPASGRPLRMISAQGPVDINPDGLTHDILWRPEHTRAFVGHARP